MSGEKLAAIELEHRLALAEKENAALRKSLKEVVDLLEGFRSCDGFEAVEMFLALIKERHGEL